MPVTVVPLVAPPTVRVSPSPGNDPAVIWTAAALSSVSSKSVRLADGESNTGAAFSTYVGGRIDCDGRGVVRRGDTDQCGRHIAVVRAVVDHHLDEAVCRAGIVAGVAVENLLQRGFVFSQRGRDR